MSDASKLGACTPEYYGAEHEQVLLNAVATIDSVRTSVAPCVTYSLARGDRYVVIRLAAKGPLKQLLRWRERMSPLLCVGFRLRCDFVDKPELCKNRAHVAYSTRKRGEDT